MVDPIGIKPATVSDRRAVANGPSGAAAASAAKPVDAGSRSVESEAAKLSGAMAAKPPVDAERVARIRKAIEDGRFPILPATIADRLLALRLEWNPNDPA